MHSSPILGMPFSNIITHESKCLFLADNREVHSLSIPDMSFSNIITHEHLKSDTAMVINHQKERERERGIEIERDRNGKIWLGSYEYLRT